MDDGRRTSDDQLETLLKSIGAWPPDDRAKLLEAAREIEARRARTYVQTVDERAAIEEGLADADRGDFIEGVDLRNFWRSLKA